MDPFIDPAAPSSFCGRNFCDASLPTQPILPHPLWRPCDKLACLCKDRSVPNPTELLLSFKASFLVLEDKEKPL